MCATVLGPRQHIVPQQMIRRFAGPDGKLIELFKPELRIGTRRRAPSGILFRDNFYKDRVSDFDAELLLRVEQNFAAVYPKVVARERLDGRDGAVLVDWIAAMLVRTELVVRVMPDFDNPTLRAQAQAHLRDAKKLLDNVTRSD
jgi:hypothetical protein